MPNASPSVATCPLAATHPSNGSAIGLFCFAAALLLNSLAVAGLWSWSASLLGMLLLNCASAQILAGLAVWRRRQPFPALLLIGFGLFWFSRLAFDILPQAGLGTPLAAPAASGNLLLWGLFALILSQADDCPLRLRLALYVLGATLLLQAAATLSRPGLLQPLAGAAGLAAAAALGRAALPRWRSRAAGNA